MSEYKYADGTPLHFGRIADVRPYFLQYAQCGKWVFRITPEGKVEWNENATPDEISKAAVEFLAAPLREKQVEIEKLREENEWLKARLRRVTQILRLDKRQ